MSSQAPSELLPPPFLFRFSVPCRYRRRLWSDKGIQLAESYVVPSFRELEGRSVFADLRLAWSEKGLAFTHKVRSKKQALWCRSSRLEDSDGLRLWIDTRDTHTVHRASRFCHQFVFIPSGGGRTLEEPVAALVPINRAREPARPVAPATLGVLSEPRVDGYKLQGHIPAGALHGFDPQDHPRLGFYYAVVDRELGWQTLSLGPEFPIQEDPSLWGTLELVRS